MPIVAELVNEGSALAAGDLVQEKAGAMEMSTGQAGARPLGPMVAPCGAGARGQFFCSGTRAGFLAPNQSVQAGDRLVPAANGCVQKMPAGYSGYQVGTAQQAVTTTDMRQGISMKVVVKPVYA